jgi:hypothetical protein
MITWELQRGLLRRRVVVGLDLRQSGSQERAGRGYRGTVGTPGGRHRWLIVVFVRSCCLSARSECM